MGAGGCWMHFSDSCSAPESVCPGADGSNWRDVKAQSLTDDDLTLPIWWRNIRWDTFHRILTWWDTGGEWHHLLSDCKIIILIKMFNYWSLKLHLWKPSTGFSDHITVTHYRILASDLYLLNSENKLKKLQNKTKQVKELSWIYNPSLEISSYFSECILIDNNSNECQFRHLHNT